MSQISTWKQTLLLVMATLSWLFFLAPVSAFAQSLPCGDIQAPSYFFDISGNNNSVSRAIEDCVDPFMVTTEPASPFTLSINGEEVSNGETVVVEDGLVEEFRVSGDGYYDHLETFLFKHEGDDYVYVEDEVPAPTENDYRDFARDYFPTDEEANQYLEILFAAFEYANIDSYIYYGENYDYLIDEVTGQTIEERYYDFTEALYEYLDSRRPFIAMGTYTLLMRDMELILVDNSSNPLWQTIKDLFAKTAYAEERDGQYIYAITFTLTEGEPEPAGPSSLLFLPGIMGSRLFEESEECTLFGVVSKQERWFSRDDCDIARLYMDESGESINEIFTETEDAVIEEAAGVFNLYKSFIDDLEDWKDDDIIADYRAVPYDWRLRFEDILKAEKSGDKILPTPWGTYQDGYIYQSLKDLEEASPSGKVVLVGHSNGGLVIQNLLATMKEANDPLLSAVEKVILVAVPQVGTPESIVGLLHGVEVGPFGWVVSDEQARVLMNTAPFAYHLLPNSEYYEEVATPVIKFEAGTSTDAWRSQFGEELDSLEEVNDFLGKESGRTTPEWEDVLTPATLHSHLLEYGESAHDFTSDWRPASTKVYEVAGTGVATPATLTYFTDTECLRVRAELDGTLYCAEFAPKLGYRIEVVIDGDGTVVVPSALATQESAEVEEWWVNLKSYNRENTDRVHKDILEVDEVRKLFSDVLSSIFNNTFNFLGTTTPTFEDEKRIIYQLHSPLDLYVFLSDGAMVGSTTPLLRGVEYRRYGEVQYLSIPEDEEDYEVRLSGLASGSFTFDVESYNGNSLSNRSTYSAVPSSTSTEVVFRVEDLNSLGEALLLIDYAGDGEFEAIVEPGLAVIKPVTVVISPDASKNNSSGTRVKNRNALPLAPSGELASGVISAPFPELVLEFIKALTLYRDLLIAINR